MSRERSYLVLDIETVPDGALWSRPDEPEGGAPSFPPAYAHEAIVIGCLRLDPDYRLEGLEIVGEGQDERGMLDAFSRFVDRHRPVLVTYNGRSFDLPVIALRCLRHGVAMPWYYEERGLHQRYSAERHIDLCDWLADHGATRYGSLDALARLIGLPGKQGTDGSQIEGMYRSGRIDDIRRYCLADVAQTALLFLRFRLLQGLLDRERYRDLAAALTSALGADARLREFMRAVDGERLLSAA
ncbi:3'-5' exonuclease [Haliangium sp.]|uniref:3'-5' exonuclease n=1 Tax=Haliangium sp. TaxID=2663208 RepID=UPI003D0A4F10